MPTRRNLKAGLAGWALLAAGLAAGCGLQSPPRASAPRPPVPAPPAAAPAPSATPGARAPLARPPSQVSPSPPVAAPATGGDAITVFLRSLEDEYAASVDLYRQGRLDEARRGFDHTLDRLLASPYDLRSQPRLQTELNSLLDRVQALESDLLPVGGLNSVQAQATPLEQVPQITFPLDAATRAQLERASRLAVASPPPGALPLPINDRVLRYVHYFTTRGRNGLLQGFERAGRYKAMVDGIFQRYGVPTDLLYMAQLESDFNPRERNGGMWQFEPARAADYGLKRNHWVDERDDPRLATIAAARHLRDLHAEFGDWLLAMAAYNAGPATVQRAVARTGYADYWKLDALDALPPITRDYVPVVLAMALIARNPGQYGIAHLDPDPPRRVDVLQASANLDLRLAAECARVTVGDLQHLNPSLLEYLVPAGYRLYVPLGAAREMNEALARVPPSDRITWRMHWVRRGDTWLRLSRRFHIAEVRLAAANHLSLRAQPVPGTPLALPYGGRIVIRHVAARRR
jgi:membrane-bound lytic murein transglycosylase D